MNKEATERRDQLVCPESVLLSGCGPSGGAGKKLALRLPGFGSRDAFGVLIFVGLTGTVVPVVQLMATPLYHIEPQCSRLGRAG